MKTLKDITAFLKDRDLINDNFDSWAEDGIIEMSGATVQVGQQQVILLYRSIYTAVLSWEAWGGNGYDLFAAVIDWLTDHNYDPDHFPYFGHPRFVADVVDDDCTDVQITIRCEDPVYRVPLADGPGFIITPDLPDANVVADADVVTA